MCVDRHFFSESCECSYTQKTTWCSRTRDMDKDVIFSRCSDSCHQLLNSSMNSILFITFCGLALFRWWAEEVDNFESSTRVSSTIIISSVLGQGRSTSLLDVHFCHSSSSFSSSEVPEFYPSPELRRSSRRSQPFDASLLFLSGRYSSMQRFWLYSVLRLLTVTISLTFLSSFSPRLTFVYFVYYSCCTLSFIAKKKAQ